jgi:YegS/Rv2252/BmrU family lipid kinase
MKHLFIINPAAGSRDHTAHYEEEIRRVCDSHGLEYEIAVSQAPGHCTELARKAAQTGEEYRIYACGGDGTLNEVVTGVVGYDNVAVTMYVGGSGNDFVKIFNDTAPFRDLEQLLDCTEEQFDLIRCNEDVSLNICSVGLDARVGHDVARYKRLPLLSGFRAYAVSALVNIIKGISEHYVVEIDGERIDGKQTMICACNGRFYGGGMMPDPDQKRLGEDRELSVMIWHGSGKLRTLMAFPSLFKGEHVKHKKMIAIHKGKNITVKFDSPRAVQIDGETVKNVSEYTATLN